MPLVQISIPAGSLPPEKKALMIKLVTEAVVEAEGIPGHRRSGGHARADEGEIRAGVA
jgi:Tautomerase enzyme